MVVKLDSMVGLNKGKNRWCVQDLEGGISHPIAFTRIHISHGLLAIQSSASSIKPLSELTCSIS